jgi:hypothetical protein
MHFLHLVLHKKNGLQFIWLHNIEEAEKRRKVIHASTCKFMTYSKHGKCKSILSMKPFSASGS